MRKEVIGNAILYLGDCLEILPTLRKVDAVITDPPYGINVSTRVNYPDVQAWDVTRPDITPLLNVGRFRLFWGGQYYADKLPIHGGWIAWCKRPIDINFHNDNSTYATVELAWRNWGKAKFYVHTWDGGMRAGAAENREFCHPSQKPVELMRWCIRQLPAEAETILDPFAGSGTTGVACMNLGRKFIGIEISEKYFEIACERIENAQRQVRMFE